MASAHNTPRWRNRHVGQTMLETINSINGTEAKLPEEDCYFLRARV